MDAVHGPAALRLAEAVSRAAGRRAHDGGVRLASRVRRLHLSHQSSRAAPGARSGISRVHPGQRQILLDLHVRAGGLRGRDRGARRPRPGCPGSVEQRAAALFQPAAHALVLRPSAADRHRRHAVDRDVGSRAAPLRAAGRSRRRRVVPRKLDARCRRRGRFPSLVADPEPGGDGQFRLREVEGCGRGGQPRVLFPPDRRDRDDRSGLSRDVGARPGSCVGGQPRVVHAAGRRSARRSGSRSLHRVAGGVHSAAQSRDRTQAAARRGGPVTEAARTSAASEPRERSEPAKRLARERVGESEGRSPSVIFEDVSKFYGEVLGVNRVTLNIPPGITSLVGPNGSGKTTLMNLMTGLIFPDQGCIQVRGISPRDPERLMRITGYATQYDTAPSWATGFTFITTSLLLYGYKRVDAEEKAWKELE